MKNTKRSRSSGPMAWILGIATLPVLTGLAGCSTNDHAAQVEPNKTYTAREYESATGPAGARGPVGPSGQRGDVGATGAPGDGITGPTGAQGPSGPVGVRGVTGFEGAPGDLVRGSAGVAGPRGPEGAKGARGSTGEQGASVAGATGASGVVGQQGAPGPRGETGVQGPTTVGPTGPAGEVGPAGSRGDTGETGSRGSTVAGRAGSTGPAGDIGAQGPTGDTGEQGPAGVIDRWTSYRTFWFDNNSAYIRDAESDKVTAIARYMRENPSMQVGIDGTLPSGSNNRELDMAVRRAANVRAALMNAGVEPSRIETGAFGDIQFARDGRVEVLLRTDRQLKSDLSE